MSHRILWLGRSADALKLGALGESPMALVAGAEGAPACSHATATPIRTTSPAPSPNVFIAPPRYRVCRMPLEDRGFSRAGGARALGWSRELGGTTRARL